MAFLFSDIITPLWCQSFRLISILSFIFILMRLRHLLHYITPLHCHYIIIYCHLFLMHYFMPAKIFHDDTLWHYWCHLSLHYAIISLLISSLLLYVFDIFAAIAMSISLDAFIYAAFIIYFAAALYFHYYFRYARCRFHWLTLNSDAIFIFHYVTMMPLTPAAIIQQLSILLILFHYYIDIICHAIIFAIIHLSFIFRSIHFHIAISHDSLIFSPSFHFRLSVILRYAFLLMPCWWLIFIWLFRWCWLCRRRHYFANRIIDTILSFTLAAISIRFRHCFRRYITRQLMLLSPHTFSLITFAICFCLFHYFRHSAAIRCRLIFHADIFGIADISMLASTPLIIFDFDDIVTPFALLYDIIHWRAIFIAQLIAIWWAIIVIAAYFMPLICADIDYYWLAVIISNDVDFIMISAAA